MATRWPPNEASQLRAPIVAAAATSFFLSEKNCRPIVISATAPCDPSGKTIDKSSANLSYCGETRVTESRQWALELI